MQTSSVDQGKGITKAELLKIVPFTKRQLTELCSEGWLPPLKRYSRPGSKKPVYMWDESVIELAKFLYDLLQWDRTHQWVRLPLWLRGYAVDFTPLRQRWLDSIDAYLQTLTQGEADNPLDNITDVVSQLVGKWQHTPTRHRPELLRRLGLADYAKWTEVFWYVLLVPNLDELTFAEVLATLQTANAAGGNTRSQEEFAKDSLPGLQTLQEILTLPRLREVIEEAPPEAWKRARSDYMTLCQFLRTITAPLGQMDLEGMDLWLFAVGGLFLVPVALAIRQRGYGHWIDDAFAWVNKLLADPETQSRLTKMSELLADPETQARLIEPEVYMRILKQLSQPSSETNA